MKKSVLFITEHYYPHIGGVEFLFQSLAETMEKNQQKVAIVTLREKGLSKFEIYNGVKIYRTWVPQFASRYFFTFLALFTILRVGSEYELFQTTTYNAAFPAWLGGRILNKKVIITIHEVWQSLWFRLPSMNFFLRLGSKWYEKIILTFPY